MKKAGVVFLVGLVSCGIVLWSCECSFASGPSPLVATFDDLAEGSYNYSLTDGGITFYDVDWYADLGVTKGFSVEYVGPEYQDRFGSHFSTPNFLTACGNGSGPGYGYHRLGSFKMTCGMDGTAGGIDIFSYPSTTGTNILQLQAISSGMVVAADSMSFNDGLGYHRLSVSGTRFDYLQLAGSGPDQNGAVFVLMDNVSITPVPEPATLLLLGLGAAMLRRKN